MAGLVAVETASAVALTPGGPQPVTLARRYVEAVER
jgi:hypothetical protein